MKRRNIVLALCSAVLATAAAVAIVHACESGVDCISRHNIDCCDLGTGHTVGVPGTQPSVDCPKECYVNPYLPECSAECFGTIGDWDNSREPRDGINWY